MKIRFSAAAAIFVLTWPVLRTDAGISIAWNGAPCELTITQVTPRTAELVIQLTLRADVGPGFNGPAGPRDFRVELFPDKQTRTVTFSGKPLEMRF